MSRTRRLFLPGSGFHITGRTQDGASFFPPAIRLELAQEIRDSVPSFGHTLLSFAVMPNHFHIVLKQGLPPLGWLMQRVMQRAVKLVRRSRGGRGHVFGEPYWSGTCASAAYLRRAIVYNHMNPTKAGISSHPGADEWTSHNDFMRAPDVNTTDVYPAAGLMLFAHRSNAIGDVKTSYIRFVEMAMHRHRNGLKGDWLLPNGPRRVALPEADLGDHHWSSTYAAFTEAKSHTSVNIDVTSTARGLLGKIDSTLSLDDVRLAGRITRLSSIRNQLIAGLVQADCRTAAIARCLRVSQSHVSDVRRRMRG